MEGGGWVLEIVEEENERKRKEGQRETGRDGRK